MKSKGIFNIVHKHKILIHFWNLVGSSSHYKFHSIAFEMYFLSFLEYLVDIVTCCLFWNLFFHLLWWFIKISINVYALMQEHNSILYSLWNVPCIFVKQPKAVEINNTEQKYWHEWLDYTSLFIKLKQKRSRWTSTTPLQNSHQAQSLSF